jgi:hypothetical protein
MRRPARIPITEAMARRADEYRRRLLADQYREIAAEVCELLPLGNHPNPPAPRLTKRLGELETVAGRKQPDNVLSAWDVLRIARDRSRLA